MERSSRKRGADQAERFAALRAAKAGVARASQYEVKEDSIYDVVSEDDYRRLVRDQLKEDSFVVDDDGTGYAGHGLEDWESRRELNTSSDESIGNSNPKKTKKQKVRKTAASEPRIDTMMQKMPKQTRAIPHGQSVVNVVDETNFMDNLLADIDSSTIKPSTQPKTISKLNRQSLLAPRFPKMHEINRSSASYSKAMDCEQLDSGSNFELEDVLDVKSSPDTLTVEQRLITSDKKSLEDVNVIPQVPIEIPDVEVRSISKAKIVSKVNIAPHIAPLEQIDLVKDALPMSSLSQDKDWLFMSNQLSTASEDRPANISTSFSRDSTTASSIIGIDNSLDMYWIDACEHNGAVYMFGKVFNNAAQEYISCCLIVRNIERNIYFLPRTTRVDGLNQSTDINVEPLDVYNEVNALRSKLKIPSWASKFVERKYAFEIPGIPQQAQWLKAMLSFDLPTIPSDVTGATFSHIFGSNTSALELFILKRKLKGPCWLNIRNVRVHERHVSWCRFEVVADNPKDIVPYREGDKGVPLEVPPLVVMCLNLKTVMNHQQNQNEVAAISAIVYQRVRVDGCDTKETRQPLQYTAVRQLNDTPFPTGFTQLLQESNVKVEVQKTERALLSYFLALMHRLDPDVLVGHNIGGFDLDVLLHRMKHHKINTEWSKLGRLRRTQWPKLQQSNGHAADAKFSQRGVVSGRLLCDTYLAAKEFVRAKNYSLSNLAQTLLKINRQDMDYNKIPLFYNHARDLVYMLRHSSFDAYLVGELMFHLQILPLYKHLTALAGNLWSSTLSGGRAVRNEYLLLHEFHENKFICPDKQHGKAALYAPVISPNDDNDDAQNEIQHPTQAKFTTGRRKPTYLGGLVLEPKRGFYDHFVMLLDFNSLYPSIIQEYNICFTTVQRNELQDTEEHLPELPGDNASPGILPRLLKTLVDRRKIVKGLMKTAKNPEELAQLNNRQTALKLTANSMYGCLGFAFSRFFAKPLAMLITAKGREILQNTVTLAEGEGMEVIYGDTDSIMVYTHLDDLNDVRAMGRKLKEVVNKRYRLLEIEIDGLFQRMLLLKKKKYAALVVEEKDGQRVTFMETKGLDLVRRDWSGLSYDASNYVLQQILSGDSREEVVERIHKYLIALGQDVRLGTVPLEKFIIYKGLTKIPEAYTDAKSQPHVTVALRLKAKGENIRVGDTVPYVICKSEQSNLQYSQRAFHPDEVKADPETHKVDFKWYLHQQVHPPIARLCAPIDGTDIARIADCLGLESSRYHINTSSSEVADDAYQTLDSLLSDSERFRDVVKWTLQCPKCSETFLFDGIVRFDSTHHIAGYTCMNPSCALVIALPSLVCQLSIALRQHVLRYQNGWLKCDDQSCQSRSRSMSVYGKRCLRAPLCLGTVNYEYSAHQLYRQLAYYDHLFDYDKAIKMSHNDAVKAFIQLQIHVMTKLRSVVEQYLERNARRYVELDRLFSFCQV